MYLLSGSFIHTTNHRVEDFEEGETVNQLLDGRNHSRQQDQEKEDIAKHKNQIIHSHSACECMAPTSGEFSGIVRKQCTTYVESFMVVISTLTQNG